MFALDASVACDFAHQRGGAFFATKLSVEIEFSRGAIAFEARDEGLAARIDEPERARAGGKNDDDGENNCGDWKDATPDHPAHACSERR
ncbi:MAG TPA: hypothetical protein VGN65_07635 [Casimicrobiaceae bacterium]